MKVKQVAVVVAAAVMAVAGPASGSIQSRDVARDGTIGRAVAGASSPSSFGPVSLTVHVDETYCATGGVQCGADGHSFAAAGPDNHNPIRLGIQVLAGRKPVNGLAAGDFTFSNPFVPAGGGAISVYDCGSCFQTGGSGMYTLFVHRGPSGNWKSGSYFAQLKVKVPTASGSTTNRALVEIEIPF